MRGRKLQVGEISVALYVRHSKECSERKDNRNCGLQVHPLGAVQLHFIDAPLDFFWRESIDGIESRRL